MRMGMSIYACMQQLCTVCDMPLTGPEADANKEKAALFGTVPTYKVCCKCRQEVGDTAKDRKYQGRWRKHAGGPPPR